MIAFVENRLPVGPTAVPLTRHGLALSLLPEVDEEVLDDLLLLTTDSVSRALAASDEPWQLRVDVDDEVVRTTLRYRPRPDVDPEPLDELRDVLMEALSSAWGQHDDGDVVTLWFELPRGHVADR